MYVYIIEKYGLALLIVLFLIELFFFSKWAIENNLYGLFKQEPLTPTALEQTIDQVNSVVQNAVADIPQALSEELQRSRLYFLLAIKEKPVLNSFVFEDGMFKATDTANDFENKFYAVSPDGKKLVFFATPKERQTQPRDWGSQAQLYLVDRTETGNPAFPPLERATVIDATDVKYKQHPSISNAGKVLFVGWENTNEPDVDPVEGWSVYLVEDGKPARFLTNGFMAKWLDEDTFVFLKNDGLYRADTALTNVQRIAEYDDVLKSNSRFDISDDGKRLVWTRPDKPQVYLYAIGENGSLQLENSIIAKSFWSVFSPSGSFVALQTIGLYNSGKEENPQARVEFYDTATMTKLPYEIDLDNFSQLNMFMSEWATK